MTSINSTTMSADTTSAVASRTPAISAAAFTQSIGVNVDMDFFDTPYASSSTVVTSLNYLGINQVRDALPATDPVSFAPYLVLAADGIKFDLFVQQHTTNMATVIANLDYFAQQDPGALASIEGPNEVNLYPITYNGQGGLAGAAALQAALYTAVRADSDLTGIPVYALTLGGASAKQEQRLSDLSSYADYGNAHVYPDAGDPPNPNWLSPYLASQSIPTGSLPIVLTEFGYSTVDNPVEMGVSEAVEAKYDLDALFDAQKAGVHQTFLYELLDGDSTPTDTEVEMHYGLFHSDGTPKLAAIAIHDLTSILADSGSESVGGALNYTVSGLTNAGGNSLLIEKSTGALDLAVWAEPVSFDTTTFTNIPVSDDSVTVSLGATYQTVEIFDPLVSSAPISTLHDTGSVQLDITDHPLIVEVEPTAPPQSHRVDVLRQRHTYRHDSRPCRGRASHEGARCAHRVGREARNRLDRPSARGLPAPSEAGEHSSGSHFPRRVRSERSRARGGPFAGPLGFRRWYADPHPLPAKWRNDRADCGR